MSGVIEEVSAVENGNSFGSYFPLEILGLDLPPNAIIPGVAVASSRATPLAGENPLRSYFIIKSTYQTLFRIYWLQPKLNS